METGDKVVVEVNGVKMEVDLRSAKVVHDNIRVGTKVKVLSKAGYDGHKVYPGVVVGFEPFKDFPTIIVAYLVTGYKDAELHFAYINSKSADKWDLVPAIDDELPVDKGEILNTFTRQIDAKRREIEDIQAKQDFFLRNFNSYFAATPAPVAAEPDPEPTKA